MSRTFLTVGHSNRTIDEFVDMLRSADVNLVADVRSIPRSRANPQFNKDALAAVLGAEGIAYRHIAALGGRRNRSEPGGSEVNAYWQNASFHNYADYALTDSFREGLQELWQLGSKHCAVVMCAEAVWWRCHRRIIADYLLHGGASVYHLMAIGKSVAAEQTASARPDGEMRLIYPAAMNGPGS